MNELKEIREKALVNVKEVVQQNKEMVEQAYHMIMHLANMFYHQGILAAEAVVEYALVANAVSFGAGLVVAEMVPGIF